MLKRMKLRHKILFAVGLPVLFISALMTWLLLLHIDNTLRENALELAQEMAYRHGNEVKSRLELPLDTARTLAHTFEGMKKGGKVPDREILNGILKNILINGRDFVSVWSCWEPFVLDGRDDEYINEKGNNRNGRYMPIWHRFSGKMRLDALSDLDYMEYARYCRLARSSGAEIITPPVELSFKDGPAFYSSLIVPVRYNAQIIGVVGITILLNDYSDMVARIRPFGAGYGILVSGTGVIVGHPRKMLIGHPVTEYVREEYRTSLIRSIQSGKPFCFEGASLMHPEKEAYFVFAPFRLGNSDTCWSFAVSVPMDKVLEESRHFARWAVLTGSLALLIMILMIYVLSRHIVKPLYTLVTVSQALAEGNFRRRANLRSRDEFGMAGQYIDSAFDSVVDKMFWYEGMLDAIPFPISVTDPEMRWTFINRAAENILGKTRAAALGRSCTEWNFHICDTDQCGVALLKQGKTNTRFQHSETGTHYQVDVAWLHNARREKIGHIEIIQDISESVRLKQKAEDRNWVRSGEAELNRVMRGEQDVAGIGKNIITFICKYLGAHTGIFYIREPESDMFSLMASYAHVRRKHLASRFREGEGLVGQAALEKVPILLTEIPEDYIRIESGLGAAPPRSIAVLPFLFEDRVRGVIELAAFREFNALEMEFLTLAVRQIGVVINMTEARVRMRLLLKKTQSQAEELQVQQEELRQANGELEAQTQALKISESNLLSQQEELRVTNENLEDRTRDLELQRDDIRKKNRALERARADIAQKVHDLELAGKYKSEFLANMSHELRTPLNSILILAQLLFENREGGVTEKHREFAKTIHSSGSDLLSLINEILDLSKAEAGKLELVVEEMRLDDLADKVRRTFEPVAGQKGLSLNISVAEVLPPVIHADARRLWQVIKNLLSNAFKFTEQGGVTLRIRRPEPETVLTAPGLIPEKTVVFEVADTGIGIPGEKQELIFEAFQQADGTTSRKYGGTGLGLSISREFARYMGGELRLVSAVGKGSRFMLCLPENAETAITGAGLPRVASGPPPAPVSGPESPDAETPEPAFVRDDRRSIEKGDQSILIVEDDPHFAKIMLDLAREKGFKGLIAEDGETGLHFADFYSPSAILLDVGLPGIDGWTVMKRLKESPETRHIPVHFISALDTPLNALKMGAVGFLTKPVSVEMLEEAFRKISHFVAGPVKQLLIVEDDPVQTRSINELIANDDVEIRAVSTAEAAYEQLCSRSFDCMILDLGLGETSGFDLLAKIRRDRTISQVPVIIYTGREITRDEEAGLQKYADSIIIKGARSPERLLDETSLFLHRVESELPPDKQKMLSSGLRKEAVLDGKVVLIVDDDMRNVFALASVLEENGIRLIEARNGREGLEKLGLHPETDLVLMDIMMPEMDGYEAMRRIRKQDELKNIPIIALTAKAMKGDKLKCIDAGANDYLAKPVDPDKLISLLRVWLY